MKRPIKWFALCSMGAVTVGSVLGATIQRPSVEKTVVTVYKSPT